MGKRNLTLMTDLYQLTMMNGFLQEGMQDRIAVFDLFFRSPKGNSAYALAAGLEQAVDYIQNLHFNEADIAYLKSLNLFEEDFLEYLKNMKFTGDVHAAPEGTPVFPGAPFLTVKAPIIEAQLLETALLNIINHQTLIATKASRVCYAAGGGNAVLEFGLRRAQGPDAGIYGARAAIVGGCVATSNVLTGQMFDVKVAGTHAHSWVMCFEHEIDAFRAYAKTYPDECLLLVDTYDTLYSGVPNAIQVFKEVEAQGHKPVGIRLDSGDMAYLSKEAREMLDEAGFEDVKIYASGDLDETIIQDLLSQGAKIDVWGVGTKLITSENAPSLGGVYKLAAIENSKGELQPKIKLSDTQEKVTTPGCKKVKRIYDRENKAIADLVVLEDEVYDESEPLTIFDPVETWKRMTLRNYTLEDILVPIFEQGELVYELPTLTEIRAYANSQLDRLWEEYRRIRVPSVYKVDFSQKLYDLKQTMIEDEHLAYEKQ